MINIAEEKHEKLRTIAAYLSVISALASVIVSIIALVRTLEQGNRQADLQAQTIDLQKKIYEDAHKYLVIKGMRLKLESADSQQSVIYPRAGSSEPDPVPLSVWLSYPKHFAEFTVANLRDLPIQIRSVGLGAGQDSWLDINLSDTWCSDDNTTWVIPCDREIAATRERQMFFDITDEGLELLDFAWQAKGLRICVVPEALEPVCDINSMTSIPPVA